ncbi:DUF1653 domain-containing protein [Candidatus Woesearchaeota archaeon]|nr:DUF1653 domain-containing protein [Candidatus Woesearchaeota archaeon]
MSHPNKHNHPKIGLEVLVLKEEKLLLHLRKKSGGRMTWSPPGGHLEWFETPEDCAKRETYEEAGIQINNLRFLTATNDLNTESNSHYISLFYLADYKSVTPNVKEPDKCERWEWFSWDNLPSPLFFPLQVFLSQNIIYQHYKGKFYLLANESQHSETGEEMMVYRSLYSSLEVLPAFYARPKNIFFGEVDVDGKMVPRFRKVN